MSCDENDRWSNQPPRGPLREQTAATVLCDCAVQWCRQTRERHANEEPHPRGTHTSAPTSYYQALRTWRQVLSMGAFNRPWKPLALSFQAFPDACTRPDGGLVLCGLTSPCSTLGAEKQRHTQSTHRQRSNEEHRKEAAFPYERANRCYGTAYEAERRRK